MSRCPLCRRTGLGPMVATALALCLPVGATAADLTLFAAASLKAALDEIEPGFEAATGHGLTVSFAGSSALARQIEAGAPADVFVSANPGWMDRLETAGRLQPGTRRDLLRNALVLIAHDPGAAPLEIGADTDLAARLEGGRLAMALVEAVPAGIYGKAALTHFGLWEDLAPQVAQADNVRAALALVAAGAAPLGIVYATDAQAESRVTVIARFPEGSHPPIIYPAATVEGADPAAAALMAYIAGPGARAVFEAQGFAMAGDDAEG